MHFAGKRKSFGKNIRRLQRPSLGTGEDQVGIDLQFFQGRRNLTKSPPPAAGQIALFVREFRGRGDGLCMSGDVQFHVKEGLSGSMVRFAISANIIKNNSASKLSNAISTNI